MKIIALVQARMGSTRLPNKVMKPLNGTPMIELLLLRLSGSIEINQIVLATSSKPENSKLIEHVKQLGFSVFKGSDKDVLDRFYQAGLMHNADAIVRITGDCPLVDPNLVDEVIKEFKNTGVDYISNAITPSFPDGLDIEVFSFDSIKLAWSQAKTQYQREHVTPYIRDSKLFKLGSFSNSENLSDLRWTVDEQADFEVVEGVFNYFAPRIEFSWKEVLELYRHSSDMFVKNKHISRNEGSSLGEGQKLWKRAKNIIPGGNMLLSKRAEMFLPDQWPAYYSKAKGCRVWDLDGKELIDMSIMGVGTNTLGYGHPEVDEAVCQAVTNGNMSTLNSSEEVYLAERLIELHPWSDMVRFARSGGEANAIAIRIARAFTGKDKVAVCGYHGWHDWYLSANLGDDKNLDGHLLPGLDPNGVPRELKGSTIPFTYNNFAELEYLVNQNDIGIIKMEVQRNESPKDNFLQKVRKLATEKNIILIFDECSSGFRQTFGGLHKEYDVEPDIAIFGKALGNGYAITAVLGRHEIMQAAQSTFISSTFWTERIGTCAALKTLEVMERTKSWEIITKIGQDITTKWQLLADSYELSITTSGIPAFTAFSFNSKNTLSYKTLITQEMLKNGYLAATSVYACIDHTPLIIDDYFENLKPIFELIRECEDGRNINDLLKGPICHSGFKRLN